LCAAAATTRGEFVLPQFRTENRFALFLEFCFPQFRTENRFALFLELL